MTTPNLPGGGITLPDGVVQANGPGGLAGFAATTEEDWRAQQEAMWHSKMSPMGMGLDVLRMSIGMAFESLAMIFNTWFDQGGGVGDPQEIQYTIEAIKQAVIQGYTIDTIVASGAYDVPDCVELHCAVIGGGEAGGPGWAPVGTLVTWYGGAGGRGGSFLQRPLDAAALQEQTLTVTVGGEGAATVIANGSTELIRCAPGQVPGAAIGTGISVYAPTTSAPGDGGDGGDGQWIQGETTIAPKPGTVGGGSAGATGGTAGRAAGYTGSRGPGEPGGAGQNFSPAAEVKSGAGGGGGGGGGLRAISGIPSSVGTNGGAGGPGGYPGGGGGGGGGAGVPQNFVSGGQNGAGGIGAPGVVWFAWK